MANKNKDSSEARRALPTDHVDYFVIDDADVAVFAHAPERIVREPPPPRTHEDFMRQRAELLGLEGAAAEPPPKRTGGE